VKDGELAKWVVCGMANGANQGPNQITQNSICVQVRFQLP